MALHEAAVNIKCLGGGEEIAIPKKEIIAKYYRRLDGGLKVFVAIREV